MTNDLQFTIGQLRGALDVLRGPSEIDRDRFIGLLEGVVGRLQAAEHTATRYREGLEEFLACDWGNRDCVPSEMKQEIRRLLNPDSEGEG